MYFYNVSFVLFSSNELNGGFITERFFIIFFIVVYTLSTIIANTTIPIIHITNINGKGRGILFGLFE